jgi:hypothetical protein
VVQSVSPAFFLFDGKCSAPTHADNSLRGEPGFFLHRTIHYRTGETG